MRKVLHQPSWLKLSLSTAVREKGERDKRREKKERKKEKRKKREEYCNYRKLLY